MKPSSRVGLIAAIFAVTVFGQARGVERTIVKIADTSIPGRQAIVAHVEIAPGASAERHTHPGDEIGYVEEGQGELLIDGQPARKVKAGDGFLVPAGVKHSAHNTGAQALKVVVVYVIEKGKPLTTPAPWPVPAG